ncbi:MAG: twin-arginine translocase TatA/TatE family subunit [Actinomycetaceae bacterium]|nr:twin-arginine translocase TatA/TatE family subunit [Actinomycetaceae bacterium]
MRPMHILIVVIVLIILFGANKLPNIAKNLGQSAKVLKKEMRELAEEDKPMPSANPRTPTEASQMPPMSSEPVDRPQGGAGGTQPLPPTSSEPVDTPPAQ